MDIVNATLSSFPRVDTRHAAASRRHACALHERSVKRRHSIPSRSSHATSPRGTPPSDPCHATQTRVRIGIDDPTLALSATTCRSARSPSSTRPLPRHYHTRTHTMKDGTQAQHRPAIGPHPPPGTAQRHRCSVREPPPARSSCFAAAAAARANRLILLLTSGATAAAAAAAVAAAADLSLIHI